MVNRNGFKMTSVDSLEMRTIIEYEVTALVAKYHIEEGFPDLLKNRGKAISHIIGFPFLIKDCFTSRTIIVMPIILLILFL